MTHPGTERSRERLRVAFLIPAFDVGGAERAVVRLAGGFDKQRFETTVVAFIRGTGLLEPFLEQHGVQFHALAQDRGSSVTLPFRLASWLRRARPDVLLTYMFHANVAGRVARALHLVPAVVCSERVVGWESPWRIRVNRLTKRWADVITTNSEAGRRFWSEQLGVPLDRIRVVYNGVDVEEFRPSLDEPARVSIGVLGRLHVANGHDWFIDALALLDGLLKQPWTCVFAGIGDEEAKLKARVADKGLTDRIQFSGFCRDAPAFLRSVQIVVNPCLVAGMPNAVLEAMATGRPVIATAVGGTPEVIQDGRSGFLVQPGDLKKTAEHLARLLADEKARQTIGAAARQRIVDAFSVDAMVERTESFVDELSGR